MQGVDAETMLWTMLNAMCFFSGIVAAAGVARDTGLGPIAYVLALPIGAIVGAGGAWTMWWIGETVIEKTNASSERKREWYLRSLYLAPVPWIVIVILISETLISAPLRMIR